MNVNQLLTEWIDVGAADRPVVLWDLIADPPAVNEAINFRVRLGKTASKQLGEGLAALGSAKGALPPCS